MTHILKSDDDFNINISDSIPDTKMSDPSLETRESACPNEAGVIRFCSLNTFQLMATL